jgi:hypothetical protein
MSDKPSTPEEIELGLVDEDPHVRARFASQEFILTQAQIERGLLDTNWFVRWKFAVREELIATPEQMKRGLADEDLDVRMAFRARQEKWEATHQANELRERFQPEMTQRVRKVM